MDFQFDTKSFYLQNIQKQGLIEPCWQNKGRDYSKIQTRLREFLRRSVIEMELFWTLNWAIELSYDTRVKELIDEDTHWWNVPPIKEILMKRKLKAFIDNLIN